MSTKQLATALQPNDRIIVTLAAVQGGKGGQRIPISVSFNGNGQQIDAMGYTMPYGTPGLTVLGGSKPAPVFPEAEYQRAVQFNDRTSANKIVERHQLAVSQWENSGDKSLQDRIGEAVLTFLEKNHGIKQTDGEHPVLKREDLTVKPAYRDGTNPVVFTVQATPIWG
jgi:hypothetical protein